MIQKLILISLMFFNKIYCQTNDTIVLKDLMFNFKTNIHVLKLIKKSSELQYLDLSVKEINLINKEVEFVEENLLIIPFNYNGPSLCGETYFVYKYIKENIQKKIQINIYTLGENAALLSKNSFLKIKKEIEIDNSTLIVKNYYGPPFKNKNQIDSICTLLKQKIKL